MELRDHPIVDYGVVNFVRNRREAKADFLRVKDGIDTKHLTRFMIKQWRLQKPGIVVQVTGSAQDFDLPAKLVQPITDGIVHAASTADAWVITGGFDAGVMSLIGSSIARHKHKCDRTPVIGVASWKAVQNKEKLEYACGAKVPYFSHEANTRSSAGLEPNHTNFLLVDKPDGPHFGTEADVLEKVQKQLRQQYNAPTVLLVIQGGPGTLDTFLRSVRLGIVVVLASDSGKLASAFAEYMKSKTHEVPKEWKKHEEKFHAIRELNVQRAKTDELTGTFNDEWPLVQEFFLRGKDHIGDAILDAVLRQSSLKQRLNFAVSWDNAELLDSQLASIPAWKDSRSDLLKDVLQQALELERPEMVKAALHHGAPVKAVDLLALYTKLSDPGLCKYSLFYPADHGETNDGGDAGAGEGARGGQEPRRLQPTNTMTSPATPRVSEDAANRRSPPGWYQAQWQAPQQTILYAKRLSSVQTVAGALLGGMKSNGYERLEGGGRGASQPSPPSSPPQEVPPPPHPPPAYLGDRYDGRGNGRVADPAHGIYGGSQGIVRGQPGAPPMRQRQPSPRGSRSGPNGGQSGGHNGGRQPSPRELAAERREQREQTREPFAYQLQTIAYVRTSEVQQQPTRRTGGGGAPGGPVLDGRRRPAAPRGRGPADRPERGAGYAAHAAAYDEEPLDSEEEVQDGPYVKSRARQDFEERRSKSRRRPPGAGEGPPAADPSYDRNYPHGSDGSDDISNGQALSPAAHHEPNIGARSTGGAPAAGGVELLKRRQPGGAPRRLPQNPPKSVSYAAPPPADSDSSSYYRDDMDPPPSARGARPAMPPPPDVDVDDASDRGAAPHDEAADEYQYGEYDGLGTPPPRHPNHPNYRPRSRPDSSGGDGRPGDDSHRPFPPPRGMSLEAGAMRSMIEGDQGDEADDIWPSTFYPRDVWDFLDDVIPGLIAFWTHKITEKAKRRKAMYYRLLREGERRDTAEERSQEEHRLGVRLLDLYVWAVLLGNTELAKVLLTWDREPMRSALLGARLCNHMASVLPIEAVGLEEAATEHEKFAIDLLDLVPNQSDARFLLLSPARHWERSVLELAVHSEMKRFIAHRHCQNLIDHNLHGDVDKDIANGGGNNPLALQRSHALLPHRFIRAPRPMDELLLVLNACCPFILTLRRSSASQRNPRFYDFYTIPWVKQVIRKNMYILYVVLFSLVTVGDRLVPTIYFALPIRPVWLLVWWTVSLWLDEWNQWVVNPSTFEIDLWNRYDYFNLFFSSLGLLIKVGNEHLTSFAEWLGTYRWDEDGVALGRMLKAHGGGGGADGPGGGMEHNWPPTLKEMDNVLLAIVNVLVWCRVLQHFSTSREIGVLIIMIIEMIKDMKIWIMLTVIFTFAFMVTFVAISDPSLDAVDPYHALMGPVWAMYGEFDLQWTAEYSGIMGQVTLWIYVLVSNVLLVNLLIAMMSDTYQEIKETADLEWKFARVSSVLEAIERTYRIPPPFSLPNLSMRFIWWVFCGMQKTKTSEELNQEEEEAWKVGGRLWTMKRRKQKIAKRMLEHYRRQEEEAAEASSEGRLKRIETLVEELLVFSEDTERELRFVHQAVEKNHEEEMAIEEKNARVAPAAAGGAPVGKAAYRI